MLTLRFPSPKEHRKYLCFPVEWQNFQIHMPPIWPLQRPSCFHETSTSSDGLFTLSGPTKYYLPGRHSGDAPGQDKIMPRSGTDVQLIGNTGIHNQLSQVTDHSSTADSIFGVSSELKPYEVAASSRKIQQHNTDEPEPKETTTGISPSTVPANREDDSSSPSSSLSSYTILTSSITENTIVEMLQIAVTLIGGTAATSDMEWQRHSPTDSRSGDRNGCFPCRLESCVSRCADRGTVVSGGTTGAHQCTGADCPRWGELGPPD